MITDPVVVNTSSLQSPTNQPFSPPCQHQSSMRQALTGPGGHSSKQPPKSPRGPSNQHRSTGWACRRQAARANSGFVVT